MKRILIIIFVLFLLAISTDLICAQEDRITQKEFAVQLVREIGFDYLLPLAPNSLDCVELLETLGISPLGGWRPNAYLIGDAYTVIIAKAIGKESVVYREAAKVCEHNREVIGRRWKESFKKQQKWLILKDFLADTEYFPGGIPACPFALRYEDKDNDHSVDLHYHPTNFLRNKINN